MKLKYRTIGLALFGALALNVVHIALGSATEPIRHLQKLKHISEKVFQAFCSINTSKNNLHKIRYFRYFRLVWAEHIQPYKSISLNLNPQLSALIK
jgi:hypothetical protein